MFDWPGISTHLPSARKEQTVVAAADRRSLHGPAGQREMAVAAAILQGRHFPIGAEQHDRLSQ